MLRLVNISKKYGSHRVLHHISLDFKAKEKVAIVGPSGCGKTTLLNIIGGLDQCSEGEMFVDDVSTSDFKSRHWDGYRNENIGFVFQQYNLIPHLSVFDNVSLGLMMDSMSKQERKKKVFEVLEKVGLRDHIYKKPTTLSGGEQQRVAIARAIVSDPDIILADEPTGALDSVSTTEIMNLLEEVAKNRLLIMVTHNMELAQSFSNRIIALQDGEVIDDTRPQIIKPKEEKSLKPKHKAMRVSTALKLSAKNLWLKKLRTSLTMLAGCVGIIGLSLVLMFSNVVSNYMDDLQKNTLANYPITIRSTVDNTDPNRENPNYTPYPVTDEIRVVREYASYYGHLNKFDESFLKHIEKMDPSLYNVTNYSTSIDFRLLTETFGFIRRLGTGYFSQMSDDIGYLQTQYEAIAGGFPTEENQLALVVDRYNNIDVVVLEGLGINFVGIDSISFTELQKKEYRVIDNDDLYTRTEEGIYKEKAVSLASLYEGSSLRLQISGILRPRANATTALYSSGVLYSSKLTDTIISNARESEIVKEQLALGLSKDVLTGKPFEDEESIYSTRTKEFNYQMRLSGLGEHARISTITIYTDLFRSRLLINQYLEEYNRSKDTENKVLYSDYMGNITAEFDAFISILTKVLLVFALIALFVSSIMTGILTYVGVVERTKEIGILRSLGAKKIDVGIIINTESGIIGFVSGIVGVILGVILLKPIVNFISNVLKQNDVQTFDLTLLNVSQVQTAFLVLVVLGSIILCMLSGLLPAIIASRKNPVEAIHSK